MFKKFILCILWIIVIIVVLPYNIKSDPQWVIAISALIVGVASIFQSYIITWFWKPELALDISLSPGDGDCHQMPVDNSQPGMNPLHYYFNLRVKNTGNLPAENVECHILELYKENDTYFRKIDLPPVPLLWNHSKRSEGEEIFRLSRVYYSIDTHFTLGHMYKAKSAYIANNVYSGPEVIFELLPKTLLNTQPHVLTPGNYRIKIGVVADNIKPLIKTYGISFEDKWTDSESEMLSKNISITPLK